MVLRVSIASDFKTQYPAGFTAKRTRGGFGSIIDIIKSIGVNYKLNDGLNVSDVVGRLTFAEFADWCVETNQNIVLNKLLTGWYRGVRLYPVLKGQFRIATRIGDLKDDGDASAVRDIVLDHMRT